MTRFWALGFPHEKVFDEIYYATEAQEMLRYGYEDNRAYMFIVHPSIGKWAIALSSSVFGDNTLGWRVAPAIAGTLSVLILTRLAMRMLRSVLLGVLAGVLLSLEGISVVMSRVSLLDIFLQFFIVAGFAALVLDREQVRDRLGGLYEAGVDLRDRVPSLGPRPYRLLAGVLFGLSFGVKWSALSFWAGFTVLSILWDRGALKSAGVALPWWTAVKRSWPGGFFSLGVAGFGAYLLSWLGWFVGENSWNRHWGDTHPGTGLFALLPSSLRSLMDYHHQAYLFHSHLYSYHAYKANPWSWLVLGRPISFYAPDGATVTGCGATKCTREILLISTPLLYWAILPMLGWILWHWVTTRDWRAGTVLMAFLAGWGVWLQNTRRTGFLFYMTPLMPFLMLGLAMAVGALLAPAGEDLRSRPLRRRVRRLPPDDSAQERLLADGADPEEALADRPTSTEQVSPGAPPLDAAVAVRPRSVGLTEWVVVKQIPLTRLLRTGLVALWLGSVVADFIWMWPLFTGSMLTYQQWLSRMWFPSWI